MFNLYRPARLVPGIILLFVCTTTVYAQNIPDKQIKKNVSPIPNSLQSILLLQPSTFEYDTENFKSLKLRQGKQYGFLAENMQQVFPSLVSTKQVSYMFGKNAHREQQISTIDDSRLVPIMVSAIQELYMEIEKLKQELKEARK
jgi:endosialidase-like protein